MLPRIFPLILLSSVCFAEEASVASIEKAITPVVQKYFPDAKIKTEGNTYEAKHGTMQFTVHNITKIGEVAPNTGVEEGPNFRGFLLQLSLEKGPYQGAAAAPQNIAHPYWTTFFNTAPTPDGNHWHIRLSFGGRLNPDFKKALLEVLPGKSAHAH